MTTEPRHRYAHTNGIRMHYVEQGDGPLVLLCHGWPESWYSWRHQIPVLAGAGFLVAAPAALLRPDMFRALGLLSVPYIPRQKLRPAVRFEVATQERHFYQHYFQRRGHVERELEADVRRSITGILYTASGEARASGAKSSFVSFDKDTRLIDNLVLPERLP